jgi:hypothetical protein
MVVSATWVNEHLHGSALDLAALHATDELSDTLTLERHDPSEPLEDLLAAFDRDGAILLGGVIDPEVVAGYKAEHDAQLAEVREFAANNPSAATVRTQKDPHYDQKHNWQLPPRLMARKGVDGLPGVAARRLQGVASALASGETATQGGGQGGGQRKGYMPSADGEMVEVTPRATNMQVGGNGQRWEFYYGHKDLPRYASPDYFYPGPIRAMLDAVMGGPDERGRRDYRSSGGALSTTGVAAHGGWHRDPGTLFEDEKLDMAIPDFYCTMLMPLDPTPLERGPTEFILGSHRKTVPELCESGEGALRIAAACADPGDVILFNGKILHRGRANMSDKGRGVLYVSHTKVWYDDSYQ